MYALNISGRVQSVPSNARCSFAIPTGTAGATITVESDDAAPSSATALAVSVSVPSGACGPCCSVLPTGNSAQSAFVAATSVVEYSSRFTISD